VLAAQAPDLHHALRRVAEAGWSHVVLDGKVIDCDRLTETKTSKKGKTIDAWYSGKTHGFGGNIQAVMRPDGLPIWVGGGPVAASNDAECRGRAWRPPNWPGELTRLSRGGGRFAPGSRTTIVKLPGGSGMFRMLRIVTAGMTVAGLVWLPGSASATPATGVSGTILARATVDGTDYILRRVTIEPGGSTGWHYHDGTLYVLVQNGTLTRTRSDCTTETARAGTVVIEPSGRAHVHIGRNLGSTPVVLLVLYINPADSPLAEDAANPGCDSSSRPRATPRWHLHQPPADRPGRVNRAAAGIGAPAVHLPHRPGRV
jgi:quercetin dioxygenase-like cupin family protein